MTNAYDHIVKRFSGLSSINWRAEWRVVKNEIAKLSKTLVSTKLGRYYKSTVRPKLGEFAVCHWMPYNLKKLFLVVGEELKDEWKAARLRQAPWFNICRFSMRRIFRMVANRRPNFSRTYYHP